jgi:hypothetical protein
MIINTVGMNPKYLDIPRCLIYKALEKTFIDYHPYNNIFTLL